MFLDPQQFRGNLTQPITEAEQRIWLEPKLCGSASPRSPKTGPARRTNPPRRHRLPQQTRSAPGRRAGILLTASVHRSFSSSLSIPPSHGELHQPPSAIGQLRIMYRMERLLPTPGSGREYGRYSVVDSKSVVE